MNTTYNYNDMAFMDRYEFKDFINDTFKTNLNLYATKRIQKQLFVEYFFHKTEHDTITKNEILQLVIDECLK